MKRRKCPAPESLEAWEEGASSRLWAWNKSEEGPGLSKREVRDLVSACLDWHGGNGNDKADWVRVCQTWIRKETTEFHPEKYRRSVWPGAAGTPSRSAQASSAAPATPLQEEMVAVDIDNVVSMFGGKK